MSMCRTTCYPPYMEGEMLSGDAFSLEWEIISGAVYISTKHIPA
jgi:hypothetical protein